ncbi:sugar ABC transporter permease [Devosia sp. YIM 151766]|uniref:carbohydrate ABC transporter permease n=1 Tax=Devosia sp. YIM 151766 TaxID=3017325 RepID=UPI00255CB47C|nr:sugar ABC transporter permease [Devosia sp. YIM 151766]WIY52537.1 sugar ABC transporter permease [Devosia sp. YIM 151766]
MTTSYSNGSLVRDDAWFGFKMSSVAAFMMAALLVIPSALTVIYSLHNVPANGSSFGEFVGFRNYEIIFTSSVFWRSVWVTLVFSVGFVVLSTVIGFAMALLLNQNFFGRGVARALLIIPWATPWLVIGILWKWYADGSVGGLNALLVGLGLTSEYKNFLADPNTALFIAIIAAVWRQASFAGILLLAGLQTLPSELYEAAELDGANWLQRLQNVTIPWLRPVLITVTVLNIIYAFLQFDVIFAMTQGGPGDATQVLSVLIYRQLFVVTQIGLGSALAVVLGVAALIGGLVTVKLLYRGESAT